MPRRPKKDRPEPTTPPPAPACPPAKPDSAPGEPAPESITGETPFTSPKGTRYRIIHTTEQDASDPPPPGPKRGRRKT